MKERPKSVYRRGADDGIVLGVYFCVLFATVVISEKNEAMSLLTCLLMFGVLPLLFFFLWRSYRNDNYTTTYSALWMEGIVGFAGGGLILATGVYCYIRFLDPLFLQRQFDMMIDVYGNVDNPRTREMVDILRTMKEYNIYPRPRDILVQLILMTVFTGSLASMLTALLVKLRGAKNIRNIK